MTDSDKIWDDRESRSSKKEKEEEKEKLRVCEWYRSRKVRGLLLLERHRNKQGRGGKKQLAGYKPVKN